MMMSCMHGARRTYTPTQRRRNATQRNAKPHSMQRAAPHRHAPIQGWPIPMTLRLRTRVQYHRRTTTPQTFSISTGTGTRSSERARKSKATSATSLKGHFPVPQLSYSSHRDSPTQNVPIVCHRVFFSSIFFPYKNRLYYIIGTKTTQMNSSAAVASLSLSLSLFSLKLSVRT